MGKMLWQPDDAWLEKQPLTAFARQVQATHKAPIYDYASLHEWSVSHRSQFWSSVWDFCAIIGDKGEQVLEEPGDMRSARFFPEARLNFAENLLVNDVSPASEALVFRGEDQVERRLSWAELGDLVSRLQQAFRAQGIEAGDRIAGMLPNMPETIAAMLAAASIGAIWSSCSPDFGERGVLDRFGQIEPKLFFAVDGYYYGGKTIELQQRLEAITAKLQPQQTIVVPYIGTAGAVAAAVTNGVAFADYIAAHDARPIEYERLPFDHPLFILFSSGTTGKPKCIVHRAGLLIQLLKEHRLHSGNGAGDRVFYFTTCGWMMWNWLAGGLGVGATLLLYDGSPFHPDGNTVFDYLQAERATFFGTSAKFIDAVRKAGLRPVDTHDLSPLRAIASTGSPLSPEGFDFVYDGIKSDIPVASISGGTDICSCFVLGVPWRPVYEGEIQGPGLGMAVDVFDANGRTIREEKGDLVCTRAFPAMPLEFWNDPEGQRYHDAYFNVYDGVWCHGDFAEWTAHGGLIIHGRSDATLNPQGVRIGTAEIYNVVEQLPQIVEAICIGQEWGDDVRVVLFVRLTAGIDLDEALIKHIRTVVREQASPRHVPARILAVNDIPRTKSGKIVELAVREVVHGRPVKNKEALANPEALAEFAHRNELAT